MFNIAFCRVRFCRRGGKNFNYAAVCQFPNGVIGNRFFNSRGLNNHFHAHYQTKCPLCPLSWGNPSTMPLRFIWDLGD